MAPEDDPSIAAATRLAQLLADTHGAEVLAELQKLNRAQWTPDGEQVREEAGAAAGSSPLVGIWIPEPTADGVALRRQDGMPEWWLWADADYVPAPAGAQRVAFVGESAARGWLLDPAFNPAMALSRCLNQGSAKYQVADLARTSIDLETLEQVIAHLPAIEPDIVVVFAGNNFTFAPLDDSYRDLLAQALRSGGYPNMRRVYVESVVLPRVDRLLASLAAVRRDHGMGIIIVVPQTNLRGWAAAADVEIPAMSGRDAEQWYRLADEAVAALDGKRWAQVHAATAQMRSLDGGLSPLPWNLAGQAAIADGDGEAARGLLEGSRDAAVGLLLDLVPCIITPVRQRLLRFAAANRMPCVDMADAVRSADLPELPDPRYFLDHAHLTREVITSMRRLGRPPQATARHRPAPARNPPCARSAARSAPATAPNMASRLRRCGSTWSWRWPRTRPRPHGSSRLSLTCSKAPRSRGSTPRSATCSPIARHSSSRLISREHSVTHPASGPSVKWSMRCSGAPRRHCMTAGGTPICSG